MIFIDSQHLLSIWTYIHANKLPISMKNQWVIQVKSVVGKASPLNRNSGTIEIGLIFVLTPKAERQKVEIEKLQIVCSKHLGIRIFFPNALFAPSLASPLALQEQFLNLTYFISPKFQNIAWTKKGKFGTKIDLRVLIIFLRWIKTFQNINTKWPKSSILSFLSSFFSIFKFFILKFYMFCFGFSAIGAIYLIILQFEKSFHIVSEKVNKICVRKYITSK